MKKELEIAYDFAKDLVEKFNGLIRAIALFGSQAKGSATEKSDIDIVVIVDDIYNQWNPVVKEWFRTESAKLIASKEEYKRIHLNTITLSVFWDMLRIGDPLAIGILRYCIPIVDSYGLLGAMKWLLQIGKIKPSREAIQNILQRIPGHFYWHKHHKLKALESLYWVFVDVAQVYLMKKNINPGSPEEIPKLLEKAGVQKIYIEWFKQIYDLMKKIARGDINNISWDTLEKWYERASKFYERLLSLK